MGSMDWFKGGIEELPPMDVPLVLSPVHLRRIELFPSFTWHPKGR